MLEHAFYEQGDIWRPERWLKGIERQRLEACLEMLPGGLASLLDVGAGNGAFLYLVEQAGQTPRLCGVERSVQALAAAVCRTPLIRASADGMPFRDQAFDLVSALELLEHLPWGTYERTLTELQRVARRYVLIDVPYRERRLQAVCPVCDCHFSPHFHMRSFDRGTLSGLLPQFRLAGMWPIRRPENLLAIAARPFRRRVFGGFPTTAICPQCGYRQSMSGGVVVDTPRGGLIHAVARRLPELTLTTEVVALYERLG